MGRYLRQFGENAIALLYPHRCPVCGELSGSMTGSGHVHPACYAKLVWVREPTCLLCGKPVSDETQLYCRDCEKHSGSQAFDGGMALWVYDAQMRRSITLFKYHGMRCFAGFYAGEAAVRLRETVRIWRPECISPVPVNARKKIQRGYNQAELVAERISRQLGIRFDRELLVRNRYTEPQKSLDPAARKKNLARAFIPGPHAGCYRRVLLVDDIYTTGATMQCCSAVLKACGVEKVFIFSLCIGSER